MNNHDDNTRVRTLVFAPYYPPHIGGVEFYTQEMVKHLGQEKMSITLITPNIPLNSASNEFSLPNVEIIRFPAFEIVPNYPLPKFWHFDFWKILNTILKKDFDLIVSHTRFFNTSLMALVFAKYKKNKWIHIEHGSDFVQSGGLFVTNCAKIYDLIIGKKILKNADHVMSISHSVNKFVHKLTPGIKSSVIYRGFNVDEIEKIEPDSLIRKNNQDKIIILFIGRLASGKGVSDLLIAFSKLKSKNAKLFIIGDGPEKNNLKNAISKLGIANDVKLFEHMSHAKTIAILKTADVFINPSYTEGLPTTVIEAALCRKAIIATDVGGTSEIITNNFGGFLTKPGDIQQLKERMTELITDSALRATFAANVFNENSRKFSWKNFIEEFIHLTRKL